MATFEAAIPVIMKHEGGWVDDPADRGGETNYGISTKMIKDEGILPEQLGLDPATQGKRGWLKVMTPEAAMKVYRQVFWDKGGYGDIKDQLVATKILDAAVNMGGSQAHKLAQRAATACGQPATDDGVLGPRSKAAINACVPAEFMVEMKKQMEWFYDLIIKNRPANDKFRKNWMKRAGWGVPS